MANLILTDAEMEDILDDLKDFSYSGSDEYVPSSSSGIDDEDMAGDIKQRKSSKKKRKKLPAGKIGDNGANTSLHGTQQVSDIELQHDETGNLEQTGRLADNIENLPMNDILDEDFIGPCEKPKKNRYARPEVWKKNIRKHSRNSGQSYVNVKGIIVPKKECEDFDCHCRLKCAENISFADRRKNFERFYSNSSWETQTAVLVSSIKVVPVKRKRKRDDSRRSETREYYLKSESRDVLVCKLMFTKTLDINSTRIHRALKKSTVQNTLVDKRGRKTPANATSDDKILKVCKHILSFPAYKSHYRRADTPDCKYLCSNLNMTKMYEMYTKSLKDDYMLENPDSGDDWKKTAVSVNTYKRIFRKDFNLKFKSPKKDTCKKCDRFKILIDAEESKPDAENNDSLKKLKAEQELHHRQAEKTSSIREENVLEGKTENTNVISFDLQKVFSLPKLTTNEAYYKRQLSVLNFGIQDLASEQAYMYIWHEGIASRGPQEIASCIRMYIQDNVNCKKLVAWSDACGGQNRNIKMVLFYMHLVAQPEVSVEEIVHKFCVSGHSYLANDRDFSQIENKIRKKDNIYSFEDFVEIVKSSKQNNKPFEVKVMTGVDFQSTKTLEDQTTNRKKDSRKETVSWLRMREIRVQKDKPGILMFKYTHDKDVPYYEVDLRKRLNRNSPDFVGQTLDTLHPEGHVISEQKMKDIKHLLKYVPEIYHDFYNNLTPTDNNPEEEDSDGIVMDRVEEDVESSVED